MNMAETCGAVILWLQTLTVASVMLNILLVGVLAGCVWDMRRKPPAAGRG